MVVADFERWWMSCLEVEIVMFTVDFMQVFFEREIRVAVYDW